MDHTLNEAYSHLERGDSRSAIISLEILVNCNPLNIEAWEAYMQICPSCEELDFICERVLQITGINRIDRESIIEYYYFLHKRLMLDDLKRELENDVKLELIDQINFTLNNQSGGKDKLFCGMVCFLGKATLISHIFLVLIGLNLLSVKNNFGYWIIVVSMLSTFFSSWKKSNLF